mgnify:CR=1 FL=1
MCIRDRFLHEPLTNIRRVIFLQMEPGAPRTEVWRALYGATTLRADCGKYVIAVNEDIDPDNGDAVFWSLAYRADPDKDIEVLRHRDAGHGPKGKDGARPEDSTLLIDATLKREMPPLALPKRPAKQGAPGKTFSAARASEGVTHHHHHQTIYLKGFFLACLIALLNRP